MFQTIQCNQVVHILLMKEVVFALRYFKLTAKYSIGKNVSVSTNVPLI